MEPEFSQSLRKATRQGPVVPQAASSLGFQVQSAVENEVVSFHPGASWSYTPENSNYLLAFAFCDITLYHVMRSFTGLTYPEAKMTIWRWVCCPEDLKTMTEKEIVP